ncbi:MAG: LysR family transcriptional regulator [Sinobacterium sp.]|nr:LysR family transcriptional regulator [Sinobacterium sp.]
MDPIKLEMFVTTKDCDSIYKAALILKKSPNDLEEAIFSLEEELGAKVFTADEIPRLTCEGQMLYLRALGILDSWYIAQGIISQLQETNRC